MTAVVQPPAAVRRCVDVDGFRLNYVVAGTGPPIVLVHGEAASVLDWEWATPRLSSAFQVHALDLPGHGDSAKPSAPYSAGLLTDALVAFPDAIDVEGAVLVGHSLGGVLVARAARRRPERVSALCLVDSGGLGRAISPSVIAETLPGLGELGLLTSLSELGRWRHAWLRAALLFARWWRIPPDWLAEQRRLLALAGFPEATLTLNRATTDPFGQKESILEDLAHLDVPTLIVWGAEDRVVPFWHGSTAITALARARLRVLPGCGHMPHVECPQEFLAALVGFLQDERPLAGRGPDVMT